MARLSVDDAGEYLLVAGDPVTIGHVQSGQADLCFLADVGPLHACLRRSRSLRGGLSWSIAPLGEERVWVEGESVGSGGWRLVDGDRVDLGENIAFRLRVPDPASRTVLLDLLHGNEAMGAVHIVLLEEGEGGRLRIGAGGERHLRIAGMEEELSLVLVGETLEIRTSGALRGAGDPIASGVEGLALPFPPTSRRDFVVGAPEGSRPPFGLAFAPIPVGPVMGSEEVTLEGGA